MAGLATTANKKKKVWKSKRDSFVESLKYLDGRRKGHIKSFKTPWKKFDDAGVEGIEWHTTVIIAGRPGSGKTLVKDQIVRESFKKNPGQDIRVLEFELEMHGRTSAIREYSSVLGKSYKYLCSAEAPGTYLSNEEIKVLHNYAKERVKYPIDMVEEPPTTLEFKKIVMDYMEAHSYLEDEITTNKEGNEITVKKKKYKKTLISLDHTYLIKKAAHEKSKVDMLYSLGETLTFLKRRYPIIFIVLSQLGRGFELPERHEDGKYGNYILDSDVFGSDAMLQHSDILIGLNRPALKNIRWYGPERYLIKDDSVLVMHFLKCRNGDVRMSFFKAEFAKMRIVEMDTPPQQERKLKTKR